MTWTWFKSIKWKRQFIQFVSSDIYVYLIFFNLVSCHKNLDAISPLSRTRSHHHLFINDKIVYRVIRTTKDRLLPENFSHLIAGTIYFVFVYHNNFLVCLLYIIQSYNLTLIDVIQHTHTHTLHYINSVKFMF